MAKSMTGFGKAECSQDGRTVSVDIKSVNNRFLDVNFRMPRLFSPIEEQLRGILKSKLSRGKIDVYVSYKNTCEDAVSISANYPVIASYLNELQEISKQFHIPYKPKLSLLMELPDAFYSETPTEDETAAALLCQAFSQAVDQLVQSRKAEGVNMEADILSHIGEIEACRNAIEARGPEIEATLREKVKEHICQTLGIDAAEEALQSERFNLEIVYYIERACISEELVRLKSHIQAMRTELAQGENIGKKMDFIVQEMNREINTIGSKSADTDISNLVVRVKSEIEKIREQVQNIE